MHALRCKQIRGAAALGLPVVVTEQYPKALGPTVPELMEVRTQQRALLLARSGAQPLPLPPAN